MKHSKKVPLLPLSSLSPDHLVIFTEVIARPDIKHYLENLGIEIRSMSWPPDNLPNASESAGFEFYLNPGLKIRVIPKEGQFVIFEINLNIGLLIYNANNLWIRERDVFVALSLLIAETSPLLTYPLTDARALIPGLEPEWSSRASWGHVRASVKITGVRHCDFRNVSGINPSKGRAKRDHDESISSEINFSWQFWESVGISVSAHRKRLHGSRLENHFFSPRSFNCAPLFNAAIAKSAAFYLPVPPGSKGETEITKVGRLIAMAYKENPDNLNTLLTLGEQVFTSPKVRWREIKKLIWQENARLKAIPLADLFTPEVLAAQTIIKSPYSDHPIHPLIAAEFDLRDSLVA